MVASIPKSTQVIEAVATTIRGINGSPDYHNTLESGQVSETLQHYTQVSRDMFPHICVVHNGEIREKEPSHLLDVLSLSIIVYFKNNQSRDPGFQENLLQDIEVALAGDVRQGLSFVHDSWVEGIDRDSEMFDSIQVFNMNVPVRYSFTFGSP